MNLSFARFDSPVGTLKLVANEDALVAVVWRDEGAGQVPVREAGGLEAKAKLLALESAQGSLLAARAG